jgi:H+/gluconate symporter-like permease
MSLFIFLSIKKWNIGIISIVASLVLMVFNLINPIKGFSNEFSAGIGSFASKWWLLFALGATFGKVMQNSGISEKIAFIMITRLKCNPILAILIISLIMSYGGISTFVIAFTMYPIAAEMFKKGNINIELMPAVMLFCPTTLAMTMLPGSPSVQNIIPTTYIDTDIYAAPLLGLIASVITFTLGYCYLKKSAGIKRNITNMDNKSNWVNVKREDYLSFIPCICLLAISFILIKMQIESQTAVELALTIGIILCTLIGRKQMDIKNSLNEGIQNGLKTLTTTSLIMGYGNLVKSMDSFSVITEGLYSAFNSDIISNIVTINIIAALTGSSATSLQLFFETFSNQIVASSYPVEYLHRIMTIASGGLDSMPYATGVVVANDLAKTEQSKTYKHVFVTCAIIPLIVLIILILGLSVMDI